jgi:transposase-like protein
MLCYGKRSFGFTFCLNGLFSLFNERSEPSMARGKYHDWLTSEGLLKLEAWARDGLTDEQLSKNIGIRTSTLYEWKKKYSEISEALKRGKEVVDVQVENALLKRALGYEFTETTKENVIDYDQKTGEVTGSHMEVTKQVTKEVQPDVTAQIFWLKNRKPDMWRDRKDIGLSGEITNKNMTDEERKEEIKKLRQELGLNNNANSD